MPRPGPNVTSDADTQPGSDSLFPTGFSGGGALVRSGSVGTGEIADGSVAAADLNLASVAAAIAARSEMTGTYALADPVTALTYNTDGTVATATEGGITTTFTYNADGSVATTTRSGVTRTYTYNGDGTLAGVA